MKFLEVTDIPWLAYWWCQQVWVKITALPLLCTHCYHTPGETNRKKREFLNFAKSKNTRSLWSKSVWSCSLAVNCIYGMYIYKWLNSYSWESKLCGLEYSCFFLWISGYLQMSGDMQQHYGGTMISRLKSTTIKSRGGIFSESIVIPHTLR